MVPGSRQHNLPTYGKPTCLSAPPPPVYHVTVWRQLTFAEAEITASLHHLALWTEEYARNTAQQAVGADPWK